MNDYFALHDLSHEFSKLLLSGDNLWLHIVFHVILIATPISFLLCVIVVLFRMLYRFLKKPVGRRDSMKNNNCHEIPIGIISFIARFSLKRQVYLCLGSLTILPITYASLELPKRIINEAIDAENFSKKSISLSIDQSDYLLWLCALFLLVIIASSIVKYFVNFYRGFVAESLIKALREGIYQKYKKKNNPDHSIIPILVQEVEPIGGFSGDSFSLPILQGGTAITIISFMMVQNIALGIAAITLLPVQMLIVPYFQRKINGHVRGRVLIARNLSESVDKGGAVNEKEINHHFDNLHDLRIKIFKNKFMMKSINNLLMNLTPFFFYSIGGFLVIKNELSLGALIASLASYKDMASSIREIFSYYQRLQDVKVRYGEVHKYINIDLAA